ncbi:MAG: DUF934 domain-containing protein [Bauldia litoralis]
MALVKGDEIVEDVWVYAGWLAEAPDSAPVILPLDVWRAEKEALRGRNAPVGVLLHPDDDPEAQLGAEIGALSLIALEFPAFSDGRAFSQARVLRERMGFEGEIRATGHVIVDQKTHLRRCGFDAVELDDDKAAEAWAAAKSPVELYYQPALGGDTPLQRLRKARLAG